MTRVAQIARKLGKYNLFLFSSFLLQHGINKLVVTPFLARHLGHAEFGSFVLSMSIVVFLASIIPSGIFLSNYRENTSLDEMQKKELFDTILTLLVILTGIFGFLYFLLKGSIRTLFDDPQVEVFIPFLAGYLVFYVVFNYGKQLLAIHLKFGLNVLFDLIYGLCICGIIPIVYYWGGKAVSVSYFVSSLIAAISILGYLRRKKVISRMRIVRNKLQLLASSAPVFSLASLALILMTVADRWTVGAYLSPTHVTHYYVGVQIASLFVLPFSLFNSTLIPIITKRQSIQEFKKEQLRLYLMITAVSVVFVLIIGFIVGPYVIQLLYGRDILPYCQNVFHIALIGQALYLLQIFSRPFRAKFFPPNLTLRIQLISAMIFVILHIVLVPIFGIVGGAVATSIGFSFLGVSYAKKVMRKIYILSDRTTNEDHQSVPSPIL